ncbi:MAG: PKD domain-containing protein, partial [Bacteroidota bacterium]
KGDSVQIGLNMNVGQVPDVEYLWTQSTGLSSDTVARPWAKPTKTTVYNLRVHKDNCWTNADTVVVTVNERPTVSGQQFHEICAGDTLQLNADAALFNGSKTGLTYHWTPNDTSISDTSALEPVVFPTQTTNYQLVAANKGCESVTPLDVQVAVKPRPTLDADVTDEGLLYCEDGNSLTLDPQVSVPADNDSLYVSWSPATGLNDSTLLNPEAAPEQSTVYYLTLAIDGASGCSVMDSVEVFVGPGLGLTLEADTNSICNGQNVNLMASGGIGSATLEWLPASAYLNPNTTDSVVTALLDTSTTLSVIATEGGCIDTASVDIEVLPFPKAEFETTYSRGCVGKTVLFNNLSSGATQYVWDFGDGSATTNIEDPIHTYNQEGIYTVQLIAKAAGGCANWDTVQQQVVVGGALAADFTSDPLPAQQLYLPNATVSFTPDDTTAVAYTWFFGDGQTSTDVAPVHTYQAAGQYEVTLNLTDPEGCSYTKTKGTYLVSGDVLSELPTVFTPNDDGVNDEWRFQYNGDEAVDIRIVSRNGQLVFSSSNPNAAWDGRTENGNQIPEGVYFYTIKIGEDIFRGNITVLR